MANHLPDHVVVSDDGLYEHDFFTWTQEQAAGLRAGDLASLGACLGKDEPLL